MGSRFCLGASNAGKALSGRVKAPSDSMSKDVLCCFFDRRGPSDSVIQRFQSLMVLLISWSFYQRQREANNYYRPVQPEATKVMQQRIAPTCAPSKKCSVRGYAQVVSVTEQRRRKWACVQKQVLSRVDQKMRHMTSGQFARASSHVGMALQPP